jgi:hypothetical protein
MQNSSFCITMLTYVCTRQRTILRFLTEGVQLLKHFFYILCKRVSLGRAALQLRATPQLILKNWALMPVLKKTGLKRSSKFERRLT